MKTLLNHLLNLSGSSLFILGVILGVLTLLSGVFPGLVIWLLLLIGFGLASLDLDNLPKLPSINASSLVTGSTRQSAKRLYTWLGGKGMGRSAFQGLLLGLAIFIAMPLGVFLLGKPYFQMRDTKNEGHEIAFALQHYYQTEHTYPSSLVEFIGNDPLRRNWEKDAWNNAYYFTRTSNGKSYTLLSAGADGKLHTDDDIVMQNQ
jgi:hypothetical protein